MKKSTLLFAFILFVTFSYSQNINPDPNGSPWIVGDLVEAPPEVLAQIPTMNLSSISQNTQLPDIVENQFLEYMPYVFDQHYSWSCAQVAAVWYCFGYEINCKRNVPAGNGIDDKTNLYHPFFTYNFLNDGDGTNGTMISDGFDILLEDGCPSYDVYDDPAIQWSSSTKYLYWMHGYNEYLSGLNNKIEKYEQIEWTDDYESLDAMKHWIAHHNNGDDHGGLAVIGVYKDTWIWSTNTFPSGSYQEDEHYISQWGTDGSHALTIVGYDDRVLYKDINNNGVIETGDFNNNGVFELSECETGAFIAVNSWDPNNFGDAGYIWIPYHLMDEGLQTQDYAYICYPKEDNEPQIVVKTNITYPSRDLISYGVGYSENANQAPFAGNLNTMKYFINKVEI